MSYPWTHMTGLHFSISISLTPSISSSSRSHRRISFPFYFFFLSLHKRSGWGVPGPGMPGKGGRPVEKVGGQCGEWQGEPQRRVEELSSDRQGDDGGGGIGWLKESGNMGNWFILARQSWWHKDLAGEARVREINRWQGGGWHGREREREE